ncbi:tetratricopeptide repeat domain protein [Coleofasciculus chthonoplastes PCC 7420]|uniref:Tetratricopeptide repeat domain protein n=1 Tax=Coleofasciculus chthonoplastes PCC 7420 TaxID=118168 RepID=B4VW01_9CYAN|nr:CHAT domain-containing protein [Coleofasciculus chthonoplastes]EDX73893.1 tetratricopeptide repeat domain protein [Coleofasciculus chthonoplastes PCC 7420]
MSATGKRFRQFLKYLGLVGLTTVLTVALAWQDFPSRMGILEVNAAIPDTSVVQVSPPDAVELVQVGLQRYQSGKFAAAVTAWQQAADLFASLGDSLNQAMVLSNLALAYQQLGQWTPANQAIEKSLHLLQTETASRDRTTVLAQVLNTQGKLQLAQGQPEQALKTWEEATETYQQVGDDIGVVRSLMNQAQALRVLGFYPRVRATLEQVNQRLQNQPDSSIKAAGLLSFGDTLRLVGDLEESETVLQESLAIAQTLDLSSGITAAFLSLGNTAYSQGELKAAIEFYQNAIASSVSPTTTLQVQLNQLRLLIELENWTDAEALAEKIQSKFANLPINRSSIYARINFSQSLLKLWRHESEVVGAGLTSNLSEKTANVTKPAPSTIVGAGFTSNLTETTPLYRRAMARLYTKPALNPQAVAQILTIGIQQAKELGDQRAESYSLGYLGQIYEYTQQWSEAKTLTEQALLLAQSVNSPDIAYLWQWQLGRLLKAQIDRGIADDSAIQSAVAAYKEAIHSLNSLRNDLVATNLELQFSFRESVEPIYRQLVSLLLQPGNKAVSQENLVQAREVIESLQLAELDNFFREACLTAQPEPVDQVDANAAVIYPIILPDRLEVIVAIANQPLRHYATNISETEVETVLAQTRRSLRRVASDRERLPLFSQLYDWLVQPIETELAASEIKTLVFALDGSLKSLPMAALYDGENYLIEKYSVALTPSLQILEPQPLSRTPIKVLVGGLSEAKQNFPALPGVESEIQQIQAEIPAQVLLNQQFTSAAMQKEISAASFPVVHLATHGQFSSDAEDTFILAWDDRVNVKQLGEVLQAREERERQPIELLVLSACQTAAGDQRAALGIAGVAVRSGARSTLATLWSVDDQSTAMLMVKFYQELAQADVTKAEALRQAQVALLQQSRFRHPYYWTPFVLLGNWL